VSFPLSQVSTLAADTEQRHGVPYHPVDTIAIRALDPDTPPHRCEWRGPRPGVTVFTDDEGVACAKIPVRVTKIVRREDTG
jgi:hypothetical protein